MAKTFKNTAEIFITDISEESSVDSLSPSKDRDIKKSQSHDQEKESVTRTMNDKKKRRERKSRRVNLLMYPTLVDHLKAKAEEEDISLNELMCMAAEEFLRNNHSD